MSGAAGFSIKRTHFVFLTLEDDAVIRWEDLFSGSLQLHRQARLMMISLPARRVIEITPDDMGLIEKLDANSWTPAGDISQELGLPLSRIEELSQNGVIVSDLPTSPHLELREIDEHLNKTQWHPYAALYYMMTRWHDVNMSNNPDLDPELLLIINELRQSRPSGQVSPPDLESLMGAKRSLFEYFVSRHGNPPPHFHEIYSSSPRIQLPPVARDSELYRVLSKRKTSRAFKDSPLSIDKFSTILFYTFGCHGYWPAFGDINGLKRTSPSGGGLHPIEAYPLLINVVDIEPGIYHYSSQHHELAPIKLMTRQEAAALLNEFTANQIYPQYCQAAVILTARFYRNYWKYRHHPKALSVIYMDAGHLSQTFYLVCTHLSTAAFITGAINSVNIEQALCLDGVREGAIAVCGCGTPYDGHTELEPNFLPYDPFYRE